MNRGAGEGERCWSAGRGLLVVGHGTTDETGAAETRRVAEIVAGLLPGVPVELGFLELAAPTIHEAVDRLAERGCREVMAAPLLLFTAGHALRDVPEALAAAVAAVGMRAFQAAALGLHTEIVTLSRTRRAEALAGVAPADPTATRLLLVGRGSSAPTAPAQLLEFGAATLANERAIVAAAPHLGFVAAARPPLAQAVAELCGLPPGAVRRVIVQPHLLFRGHVEEQVTAAVARGRGERPDIEWIQVARLGGVEPVARAVVGRAAERWRELADAARCGAVSAGRRPA
ncbi:MAG: sirohydrochlorin chelatase [Planctomycetia bacterium]|jgi:sirohydrochlorin ferrochelatase